MSLKLVEQLRKLSKDVSFILNNDEKEHPILKLFAHFKNYLKFLGSYQ